MLSQHESEILNGRDQRLSFSPDSALRSALRVANFQMKKNIILKESLWDQGMKKATVCAKKITAVISHTRPPKIIFPFQKLRFGGRQSNVSMTITASGVTGTNVNSQSIRVALSSLLDSSINRN